MSANIMKNNLHKQNDSLSIDLKENVYAYKKRNVQRRQHSKKNIDIV